MNLEAQPTPHGHLLLGSEGIVYHCHHYNLFLEQSVRDALHRHGGAGALLEEVATGVVYTILAGSLVEVAPERRLGAGLELLGRLGFGRARVVESGAHLLVEVAHSHYAVGWLAREGMPAAEPICRFTAGYLGALAAVAYERSPDGVVVREASCAATTGGAVCRFELEFGEGPQRVTPRSHGYLVASEPATLEEGLWGGIRPREVLEAVAELPLVGNEEGLIPAFGVLLTRHFANYYNGISFRMLDRLYREGLAIGRELLIEAGHVCAFHTFGGVMTSPEWDAVVRPQIRTREDWIYGAVAIANALGWGRWLVRELVPRERLVVTVHDGYESCGYGAAYTRSAAPTCFLAQGAVAGLMNLLYKGRIDEGPELTQAFYEHLFRSGGAFMAEERRCRSQGDPYCEIVATWRA